MDVLLAVRLYINKMIEESGPGMKVLLMDKETISMVSVVYAQSEALRKDVYLFERLDGGGGNREVMKHLKCICFVRPSRENVDNLCHEFKFPKYGSYYIYFSNIIPKSDIKQLAECDEQEVVKEIQEFYVDYVAVSSHVFSLNINNIYHQFNWNPETQNRVMQGLSSVLLALRKAPLIRYQNSSEMAHRLAERVRQLMARESALFDFPNGGSQSVLLILDRREDAVTPLLNQWTYQAMVHELLGITNNRVSLADVPNVSREMQEVVLSSEQDEFYSTNKYNNFGEIATSIKQLMEEYQSKAKMQTKVESIADMKSFIENYPQFKKISGTVSKHVTVVSELSRLVAQHDLLQVSELEQEIVAGQMNHADCFQRIRQVIGNPKVTALDSVRLVMLYVLRFEKDPARDTQTLLELLRRKGASDKWIQTVEKLPAFGGSRFRLSDLFNNETVSANAFMRRLTKGIRGVENIYTQHSPLVKDLVDQLVKGRLREPAYPYLGGVQLKERPQDVIVFILGGITYEEAYAIHELNKTNPMCRVVIGGTTVHNAKSFLEEVFNADQM